MPPTASNPVNTPAPTSVDDTLTPPIVSPSTAPSSANGVPNDTGPEVVEKETVVVKEKKVGSGGCMNFSLKSFCCYGCLLLILAVVGSIVFLYMVFFSNIAFFTNMRTSVTDRLDQWFTGDIPTYQMVDTQSIRDEVAALDIDTNPELTIELSEDEFNSFVAENVRSALESEESSEIQDIEVITDLTEGSADVYIKVDQPALPTILLHFANDSSGQISVTSTKILGVSLGEDTVSNTFEGEDGNVLSPNFIFESVILGNKSDQFQAKEIFFEEGSVRIMIGVRGE